MRVANPRDVLSEVQTQKGKRIECTREWILNRGKFSAWSAEDKPQLLRLIGRPGIGKTMMSTFLVEELQRRLERAHGKALAYVFCDDKDEGRREPTTILRSLIQQLLLQRNKLFQHIQPDFEAQGNRLFRNSSTLCRIFKTMLTNDDALDECNWP
ncbi:hypothetical protein F5Y09DRAFT_318130 [Xylaria sp. FL1042]|nr:hypothetical protein F5Y09DRAFT_318130 [Xylaria sp. FL1042]